MPTEQQIAEQIQLERDQIKRGLKKLRDNTMQLENKDYASATVYGVASIDTLLPLVVKRIKETNDRIHQRKAGQCFAEIRQYLADIEPEAAAAIACKLTFDKVFGYRDKSNQLVKVTEAIGHAVEDECQMRHYEREDPGLLNILQKNYWHKSCGTHQKIVIIKTLMKRYEVPEWQSWGSPIRVKLGGWLLDCIIQASGWFTREAHRKAGKQATTMLYQHQSSWTSRTR